jgi:hypothetical protein
MGRTHLHAQPTAALWKSTGYHRMGTGDLMPPSTGRVHMVAMGSMGDPMEHFLAQMTTDANMGAKRKIKGPFKKERGRSLVMHQSRHTSVRKRNGALEFTIRRGVTAAEVDSVIARLTSHRMSVHSTWVYLLDGPRRLKLGKLATIDLDKLRAKLFTILAKRPHVGLHIVDEDEEGALHKHRAHNYRNVKIARGL